MRLFIYNSQYIWRVTTSSKIDCYSSVPYSSRVDGCGQSKGRECCVVGVHAYSSSTKWGGSDRNSKQSTMHKWCLIRKIKLFWDTSSGGVYKFSSLNDLSCLIKLGTSKMLHLQLRLLDHLLADDIKMTFPNGSLESFQLIHQTCQQQLDDENDCDIYVMKHMWAVGKGLDDIPKVFVFYGIICLDILWFDFSFI